MASFPRSGPPSRPPNRPPTRPPTGPPSRPPTGPPSVPGKISSPFMNNKAPPKRPPAIPKNVNLPGPPPKPISAYNSGNKTQPPRKPPPVISQVEMKPPKNNYIPPNPPLANKSSTTSSSGHSALTNDNVAIQMQEARDRGDDTMYVPGYGDIVVPKDAFEFSRKKEKSVKWAPFAFYQSMNTAVAGFFLGICAMQLGSTDKGKSKWGDADIIAGIYVFFGSFIMGWYELTYGQQRKIIEGSLRERLPVKAIVYFILSLLCWASFATMLIAMYLLGVSFFNYMAWRAKENNWAYRKPYNVRKYFADRCCGINVMEAGAGWYEKILTQGDGKKVLFVILYCFANFVVLCWYWDYHYSDAEDTNEAAGVTLIDPFWLGMAKGFGTILDINMSVILLPVCRTFLRYLYNLSTASQTTFSKTLRYIFSFTPLDRNLEFHKFCALFVYVAAWLHTFAHFMNYSSSHAVYDNVFEEHIWVSGTLLLLIIHFLYSSAASDIRWGKFELFWYNHHLFILFFLITLIHGEDMWNPNFWKYFTVPGVLYAIERCIREVRSREHFGVVSVTHMKSKNSSVLFLELQKRGAMRDFKPGQYVFLKSPFCSKYQWHPFTIASAPEHSETFTIIIRNQGPGSWTGKLQEFFATMAPTGKMGAAHYRIQNQDGSPKYMGPDGNPLIQVDGPYAAPTQHIGEYNVSVIVGAGIGVTPVRATLQSVIHHRFKYDVGNSFPNHAHFHWALRWTDLSTFAFMMRTLKDAEDEWTDMMFKDQTSMESKTYEVHIWISRVPEVIPPFEAPNQDFHGHELNKRNSMTFGQPGYRSGAKLPKPGKGKKQLPRTTTDMFGPSPQHPPSLGNDDSSEIRGSARKNKEIEHKTWEYSELDLYRAFWEGKDTSMGHIHIHNGRPKWDDTFTELGERYPGETIGFMLCGPPAIGDALKVCCGKHSDFSSGGTRFKIHTENF